MARAIGHARSVCEGLARARWEGERGRRGEKARTVKGYVEKRKSAGLTAKGWALDGGEGVGWVWRGANDPVVVMSGPAEELERGSLGTCGPEELGANIRTEKTGKVSKRWGNHTGISFFYSMMKR